MNIDVNGIPLNVPQALKSGDIYQYNPDVVGPFSGSLYIICSVGGKLRFFSLRDGCVWSSDSLYGSQPATNFQNVTHLVKLTNV